jgi:hypothetical protein
MLEVLVAEVVDLVDDFGRNLRNLDGKVLRLEREYALRGRTGNQPWRVGGPLILRPTRRNRILVREFLPLLRTKFVASSATWLTALTDPTAAIPDGLGLLWTDVRGERLTAARIG